MHITSQAEEAYSFVPLTADTVKGDGIDTSSSTEADMRTDIYLLSPKEFEKQAQAGSLPSNPHKGAMGVGAIMLNDKGIELRLALNEGTEDYKESFLGSLAIVAEQFGGGIDNVTNESGIPITESIEQDSSQALVHYFGALVAETTFIAVNEFLNVNSQMKELQKATKLGASGIAGAGVIIGLNGLLLGETSTVLAEMALAYAGFYSYAARRVIKEHLRKANTKIRTNHQAAAEYANVVAHDIHATYCTTHFDRQAEAMLSGDA